MPDATRVTVGPADLDAQGHLASFAILRTYDAARNAYLRAVTGAASDAELGVIFAEAHISFRSPVREGETITVTCSVGDVRRSSLRVWFETRTDDRLVAEGHAVLVGYDHAEGHAAPLREEVAAQLRAIVA